MTDETAPSLPQGKMEPPTAPVSGTETVTVACKIPAGIIFDLCTLVDDYEPVLGGGKREIKRAEPTGVRVSLRGPARDLQAMRAGQYVENPLAGGYALNPGIPAEHWAKVERDYASHPALLNRLVFAQKSDQSAIAEARNLHQVESGFEGIDPANPAKRTGMRSVTQAARPASAA